MKIETLKYYNEANVYWKEKGYDGMKNCAIINYQDKGWMWIREQSESNNVHLSRFVVDDKKTGVGSKMIDILKDGYESITAWVKPDVFRFYIKNDFQVWDDSRDEYGYYLCVWNKDGSHKLC